MRTLTLVETAPTATAVRTLTLAGTTPIASASSPPTSSLLARLAERFLRWRWPGEATAEPALARAIAEAFESLARECRT